MAIDFHWLTKQLGKESLSEEEQAILRNVIEVVYVPPQMPIMHQGTNGNALYILYEGSVDVIRRTGSKMTVLARNSHSRIFGELSLLTGKPVSAGVVAVRPATLYKINRERFCYLMREHSELALGLMAFIVRNLGSVIAEMDETLESLY